MTPFGPMCVVTSAIARFIPIFKLAYFWNAKTYTGEILIWRHIDGVLSEKLQNTHNLPSLFFNGCLAWKFKNCWNDCTVLMAENANDLQKQLNIFKQYCDTWKLKVNVDKSNVLIFSSGRTPKNLRFLYDGKQLDIVDKFNYLGITFTKSGSFLNAKKDRVSKGTQAMYSVLKKGKTK